MPKSPRKNFIVLSLKKCLQQIRCEGTHTVYSRSWHPRANTHTQCNMHTQYNQGHIWPRQLIYVHNIIYIHSIIRIIYDIPTANTIHSIIYILYWGCKPITEILSWNVCLMCIPLSEEITMTWGSNLETGGFYNRSQRVLGWYRDMFLSGSSWCLGASVAL